MASKSKAKGRKGKLGKKKGSILAYYNEQRDVQSHIRRVKKNLKRYSKASTDTVAVTALERFTKELSPLNARRMSHGR